MTPLLVLDVDGVLNACGPHGLDSDKCEQLRRIVTETGCHILISGTWRKYPHQLERVVKLCADIGATMVGCTPVLERMEHGLWQTESRGREIDAWLKEHPDYYQKFVIVDDGTDMQPHMDRLVKTGGFVGLTQAIADEIIIRLNK